MSNQHYDVFVSYSKHDHGRVKLFVDALEAAGLTVFYDKKMRPGATWTKEIEEALATSTFVTLCLTPSTMASSFVEAEIRRSQERVIPVVLEPTDLTLVWEALIGRIQRLDLTQSQFNPDDPQFSRLLSVLTGRASAAEGLGGDKLEAQARQLIENSSAKDRCLVAALAVMGGASTDDISEFANYFEGLLIDDEERVQTKLTFESFNKRLARLGAEQFVWNDPRFKVQVECARFIDPALSHRIFALSWSDYEPLREAIVKCIKDWSTQSPLWIRLRLALSLGVLAQDERRFDTTWRRVLRPMLFKNAPRLGNVASDGFDVADAALSIAAMDPARRSTVEAILDELIIEQSVSPKIELPSEVAAPDGDSETSHDAGPDANKAAPSLPPDADKSGKPTTKVTGDHLASGGNDYTRSYVLARLAFGYTGASFPELAIKALRRLADKRRYQALGTILEKSFREAVSTAREAGDLSLRNPMNLLSGLLQWARDADKGDQAVPLAIFAYGLSDLPLYSDDPSRFSLTAIMQSKRGIACVRWGFLKGLELPDTRSSFEELLRDWRDRQREERNSPDPVAALVCTLIHGAEGEGERKRRRVTHIFRHHYDDATLNALAAQAPVLTDRSTSCLSK